MAPVSKKTTKKKLPAAPLAARSTKKVAKHPMFEKTPKNFRVGGDIQPRRDLTRYVRWPKYILIQRQRRVLLQRLKVPPALNQFNHAVDKNQTAAVLRLFAKYKPETSAEKSKRLQIEAQKRAGGVAPSGKKPPTLKHGINQVTQLVENKRAKLVVIAHDVDPIELVCWLPALCRRKDVPYCVIKSKARLGKLAHRKTTCAIAVEMVKKEDQSELDTLCRNMKAQFNDNVELRRRWGGGIMGLKSQHVQMKKEKAIAIEAAKKLGLQQA
eukprot:GHVS01007725.1.p1 GENE.GHVS01007725.1~~GHVS01007725.1.p1  ORF type:complete len:269 (+),score=47.17 GHVS01007725.1:137-943(+)